MIVFNQPLVTGREEENIQKVFATGNFCGNGEFSGICEARLRIMYDARLALLTSSCSGALEIAALAMQLEPGDEVILPSFTHVGTASAFARMGAKLVWCDIRRDTRNIDENLVEGLVTDRTKAVVAVHYSGIGCEIERIREICDRHGIYLIEDNACGIDSKYRDRLLGTFGDVSALSFHQTKNIHCGEGGAVIVNNADLVDRIQIIRDRGTNRRRFDEKKVNAYTWRLPGSNYFISELQGAFLHAQLDTLKEVTDHRTLLFHRYLKGLKSTLPTESLPVVPDGFTPNGHAFFILCSSEEERKDLIDHLHREEIQSAFHYQPLHQAPYWNGAFDSTRLPVTEDTARRILRLPMHFNLTLADVDRVCEEIHRFFERNPHAG